VREIVGRGQVRATEDEGRELLRRTLAEPELREQMLLEQRRRRPQYGASRMTAGWKALYGSLLGVPQDGSAAPIPSAGAEDDATAHVVASRHR
jgi:hypothetical protein